MYAVIQTGGKQYRVQAGDFIQVEHLDGEVGSAVTLDQVLLVEKSDKGEIVLGKPLLSGAKVTAEIVGQGRGEKHFIIKMKRRKGYRKTQGHRQEQTQLLITGLDSGAGDKAALSSDDKSSKLGKFQSHLTAKGSAFTAPKGKRRVPVEEYLKKKTGAPAAKTASKKAKKKTAKKTSKKAAKKTKVAKKKAARKKTSKKKSK